MSKRLTPLPPTSFGDLCYFVNELNSFHEVQEVEKHKGYVTDKFKDILNIFDYK